MFSAFAFVAKRVGLTHLNMYTFLGKLVSIAPLTYEEWKLVVAVSAPVCLLEEMMKFFVRQLKPNKSN